jgi:phenylalanyl-tRNA synthetase beta subunit
MTDEIEAKAENCRLAMKAAMEAIQDYCGMAPKTIRVGGVEFQLPEEIYEIVRMDMDAEWKIREIAGHKWTREEADKICYELIRAKDIPKCGQHLAQSIAHAIVTGEELSDV